MFGIFKKKCPICKMELEKGKDYPEGFDKKFCSEGCKDEYGKQSEKGKSKHDGDSCCH